MENSVGQEKQKRIDRRNVGLSEFQVIAFAREKIIFAFAYKNIKKDKKIIESENEENFAKIVGASENFELILFSKFDDVMWR